MKKILIVIAVITMFLMCAGMVMADNGPLGPNPGAGDGIPDGSSLNAPNGPNGDTDASTSVGPAPNAGDGVPDGSGL